MYHGLVPYTVGLSDSIDCVIIATNLLYGDDDILVTYLDWDHMVTVHVQMANACNY